MGLGIGLGFSPVLTSAIAGGGSSGLAPDYAIDFTSNATAVAAPATATGSPSTGPYVPVPAGGTYSTTDADAVDNVDAVTVIADMYVGAVPSPARYRYLSIVRSATTISYGIGLDASTNKAFWNDTGIATTTSELPVGRHVVAFVRPAGTATTTSVYVDGSLFDTIAGCDYRAAIVPTVSVFGDSAASGGSNALGSGIWDLEVHDAELDAAEVATRSTAIGPTFPDAWVSAASYSENDVVRSSSLDYYAIQAHSGETTAPASDTTNWTPEWVYGASYTAGDVVGWGHYDGGTPDIYYALTTHSGQTTTPDADGTNWTTTAPASPPVFDAAATGEKTSGTSMSWSHTVTASGSDRVLLVAIADFDEFPSANSPPTVTYGGDSMTLIGNDSVTPGASLRSWVYYLANPSTGANTVSVTGLDTNDTDRGVSVSYAGASQTAPTNITCSSSTSTGTSASNSITPANAGSVIVEHLFSGDAGAHTAANYAPGDSQTVRNSGDTNNRICQGVFDVAAGGTAPLTLDYSWTTGSAGYIQCSVELEPA